ncbi:hypothetical protein GQX73_g4269 [Xylaria multiplex]|uniref:Transcription factor domain-containing protein n=1 Tax=Xylaria multiplex TaxID=323545 RepID=A0A7C8IYD4_9PEZI|nr:hypothetical protein GQX73_g4269 [Xylaria multiplex]
MRMSGNPRVPSTARRPPPSPIRSASSIIPLPTANDVSETPEIRSPDGQGSRQMAAGYLGFTSFSAVYEETQISLSRLQGSHTTPSESEGWSQETSAPDEFALSARTREACLFVLQNVPEPARGRVCLRGSPCEAWYYYFLDRVLESFYEVFGHYFGARRSTKSLEELATILCRNTTLPFSDDDDIQPDQWLAQFSGPSTRWEVLGLIFGFWDFSVNSVTLRKTPNQDEYGRPSQTTKQCVDFCLELCNEFSPANSMLLFLTYKRLVMQTVLHGDMSRKSWLFLGEVIALLTFLGYHILPGRPPLMSQSYNTTPLPLDISNSTLWGVKELTLAQTTADTGSDKHTRRYSITFMRARAALAMLREEIMHLALSTKRHTTVEELLEIKARESHTIEGFPAFMKYNDSDLDDQRQEVSILYWRLLMRLEHLLNVFFIERLLLKHGHTQSQLLSVSFDMITYTLPFWTHQGVLLPLRGDCEWLIMAFGVPAGGILCQELLKPTIHNDPRITRSSLIQKLSLLVGFLDWIKPTAPNGDLCGKCKTIIKHVLDQALNAPAPGYESAPGAVLDWDFATQVDFDFDLLDTFGWARSEPALSQQTNA